MTCKRCGSETPENALYCPFCGKPINDTPRKGRRGNGQGNAYKRGKTWTGRRPGYNYIDEDGVQHRIRPTQGGFATKKEALAWACAAVEKEKPLPKLIDLWQGYSENDLLKLSASKQTAYKIARKRLESIINRRIDKLTVDDLQRVVNKECPSFYTAKDVKDLLSNLYQRAMASNDNHGRVTQNLSQFLIMPDYEEKEAVPFTEDEIKKLWTAYENGETFVGYILLMCYTGMMPSEVMKCKLDMIDLENCEIRGAGAKTKTRQKSAIAFPVFLKPVVEALTQEANKKGNIVRSDIKTFYKRFYASLEKAGIDNPVCIENDKEKHRITPYSCRHTYGTEAVKAGFHPAMIQKMLRHSNTKTQEKYTHLASDDLHEAVNALPKGISEKC